MHDNLNGFLTCKSITSILFLSPLHDNMKLPLAITSALTGFGLSGPELSVYIALLELGAQPASVLAKRSHLKRGHTYNMLRLLSEKGIVQSFERGHTTYYSGSSPSALLTLLDHQTDDITKKKQHLVQVIPDLERIRNPLSVQPKVRLFEGVSGMKEMYEDTLKTGDKNLYALGDFDHYFPHAKDNDLNELMWDYSVRRAKAGIWYIGNVNKSKTTDLAYKKRKDQKRKFKMLTGIDLSVEVNIYGNKVAIISSSKDMVGLIIEDKPTADTLRNFHRAVWAMLPDYHV